MHSLARSVVRCVPILRLHVRPGAGSAGASRAEYLDPGRGSWAASRPAIHQLGEFLRRQPDPAKAAAAVGEEIISGKKACGLAERVIWAAAINLESRRRRKLPAAAFPQTTGTASLEHVAVLHIS